MATTRLTKEMREEIKDALVKHRFDADGEAILADMLDLGQRMFVHACGGQKVLDKLKAQPKGWFPHKGTLNIIVRGVDDPFNLSTYGLTGNPVSYSLIFPEKNGRVPCRSDWWSVAVFESTPVPFSVYQGTPVFDHDHELYDEIHALSERAFKHIEARLDAAARLAGILGHYTAVEKLADAWPEVKPFVPEKAQGAVGMLPAIPVQDLNNLLRLP